MVNTAELTEEMRKELSFSEEDRKALKPARSMPITFDEDCPETTPERAAFQAGESAAPSCRGIGQSDFRTSSKKHRGAGLRRDAFCSLFSLFS